jgi:hypothetical protein
MAFWGLLSYAWRITEEEKTMTMSRLNRAAVTVSVFLAIAGCSTAPEPPKESAFPMDYSKMHTEEVPGGGERLVYRDPNFTPANYNAVMLDQVIYYPQPQPTDQVSAKTLEDILNYINSSLREKFGQQVRLVDKPGVGVARITIAITAVGMKTESLKAYQYIPIAFVVTAAMSTIEGGRPKNATIALESRVIDSMTGRLLYASVRGGTGERIEAASNQSGVLRAADLEPLINQWTTTAAAEVNKYVASK